MNLDSGAGLIAAIGTTLNREDLTPLIPAWIQMAEAGFNRDIRLSAMLKRVVSTDLTDYVIALPLLCAEVRNLTVTDPSGAVRALTAASPDMIDELNRIYPAGGYPQCFAVVGTEIELAPRPTAAISYELLYYEQIPALGEGTNWLLTKAPDLYLYGSLVHSAPYLVEDERLQTWAGLALAAMTALKAEDERTMYSGGRLNASRRGYQGGNIRWR
jgi:hypothetical protein